MRDFMLISLFCLTKQRSCPDTTLTSYSCGQCSLSRHGSRLSTPRCTQAWWTRSAAWLVIFTHPKVVASRLFKHYYCSAFGHSHFSRLLTTPPPCISHLHHRLHISLVFIDRHIEQTSQRTTFHRLIQESWRERKCGSGAVLSTSCMYDVASFTTSNSNLYQRHC